MNTEEMLKLADFLENLPSNDMFVMETWFSKYSYSELNGKVHHLYIDGTDVDVNINDSTSMYNCNTAGCIAGWAIISTGSIQYYKDLKESPSSFIIDTPEELGAEILGLSKKEAEKLFYTAGRENVWWRYREEFDSHYIEKYLYTYTDDGKNKLYSYRVDPRSISHKDAAQMLRGLATGLYSFDDVRDSNDEWPKDLEMEL